MKTHLVFGLLTLVLLIIVIGSRREETFTYDTLVELAQDMARGGYLSASPVLPKELQELNYDQMRDIRWKDQFTLWRREGLPFQARFFHPGGILDRAVEIHEITDHTTDRLRYSPDFFDYGQNTLPSQLPDTIGYAGFRIHHPLNKPDVLDEVLVFQGASYFRALARGQHYGISARGLAINTSTEEAKEEFPVFTKFWLRQPAPYARHMTIYALLEGQSVVGAYQFDIEPGDETRIHVVATLFFRKDTAQAGYAPLTSMYWFGENTSNTFGDFRPEVHDSDGLLMQRSNDEWVWHPLAWSRQLQVNVFADNNPKGFGLLQRDRDFNHYQDLEAHYHLRPSVWIHPVAGFENGAVHLIQLPTQNEFMDNVVAFWTPADPPPVLTPIRIEYTMRWFTEAADLPPVGSALSTRVDDQDKPYYRHFFVEFGGGTLGQLKPGDTPAVDLSSSTGASFSDVRIEWNDFNSAWRVSFFASTPENQKPHELMCRLLWEDKPVTETWSYTWMP